MSDDTQKALQTALARLAALEAEVSGYRSQKKEPEFDQQAFRQKFVTDPIGVMSQMGAPVDHVTRVLVAHALGDQAPPELKVLATMGPTVSATHALQAQVEALSRQLTTLTSAEKAKGVRERFKALAKDKTKYPNLASVIESDPSYFDDEISDGADVEAFAASREGRLAPLLKLKTPPASEANADETAQSTQGKPAIAGAMNGDVPPLPRDKTGVFTQEDHQKLRDEIVRKYSSQ